MMKNEMELLKELEFVRFGGTKQEYRAAMMIMENLKELGLKAHYEAFPVQASVIKKASLSVVAPYSEEIKCRAYFASKAVSELRAPLYYYPKRNRVALEKVKGKIVMVDGYLGYWTYKDLYENGALGIVVYNGDLYDDNYDIDQREIRQQLKEVGILPVMQINTKDAYKLLQNGASDLCMNIDIRDTEAESGNVVCDIVGQSNKTIVFTAHYDSTWLSKGSYDNASGTVGLLKIAEYYKENPPYHNVRFVFCGSEERGLLGSKAYVEAHKEELKDIVFCINLDMIGSTMGHFDACVTAEKDLVSYLRYYACEKGVSLNAYHDVYSSDSTPFADNGVPAMSFARKTMVTPIHCYHDTTASLTLAQMQKDIAFIIGFASRLTKAKIFPVERKIPDDIKEKLDFYMCRKRREDK